MYTLNLHNVKYQTYLLKTKNKLRDLSMVLKITANKFPNQYLNLALYLND